MKVFGIVSKIWSFLSLGSPLLDRAQQLFPHVELIPRIHEKLDELLSRGPAMADHLIDRLESKLDQALAQAGSVRGQLEQARAALQQLDSHHALPSELRPLVDAAMRAVTPAP